MTFSRASFLLAPLTALLSPLAAQDLRTLAPQPPPAAPGGDTPPVLAAPPAEDQPAPSSVGAAPALLGIVLLDDPARLRAEGLAAPSPGIDASAVSWLNAEAARRALTPLLGKPLDPSGLLRLRRALTELLLAQGQGFARVGIPVQEVREGVLQIVLTRGRVGIVRAEGAERWSAASYVSEIRLQPGDPIDQSMLEADVDWLNRNPFRTVRARLLPGTEPGSTDIIVQPEERRPWRLYTGYDNTGNTSTDRDRVFAGLNWGAPFGRADQFSYQFTADPEAAHLRSHSASYTLGLPWRHTLLLSAAHADIEARLPAPLDQEGSSTAFSARYSVPLAPLGAWSPRVAFGADYKRSDNNLLFAAIPVTDNLTEIVQAVAEAGLSRADRLGYTDLGLAVHFSPGELAARNDDAAFGPSRAGAEASYTYATLDLTRVTRLSAPLAWRSSARAQLSSANLLGSEQLAFGGASSLRGYEDGEVYADEGLVWVNELELAPRPLLARLGVSGVADRVSPRVFVDAGWARVHDPLPGEAGDINLLSTGLGLRYTVGDRFTLDADYGWQLEDSGLGSPDNHRGHVRATLSW